MNLTHKILKTISGTLKWLYYHYPLHYHHNHYQHHFGNKIRRSYCYLEKKKQEKGFHKVNRLKVIFQGDKWENVCQTEWPICPKVRHQNELCCIVGYMHCETEEGRWNKIVRNHMGHSVFQASEYHHKVYIFRMITLVAPQRAIKSW